MNKTFFLLMIGIALFSQEFNWDEPVSVTHVAHQERCREPAICIDNQGRKHIVYTYNFANGTKYLLYSYFNGDRWLVPDTIYRKETYNVYSPKILLDKDENAHIVFTVFHSDFSRTFYTTKNDTGWTKPLQISDSFGSSDQFDFCIDTCNTISVFFSTGDIYKKVKVNYNWSEAEIIPTIQGTAPFLKVVIDNNNTIHIVYTLRSDGRLYYLKYEGNIWKEPIPISNGTAYDLNIYIDEDNNPCIVWAQSKEIYYTNNISGNWQTPVNISNLQQESRSPNLSSFNNQPVVFFHTFYNNSEYQKKNYAIRTDSGWVVKECTFDLLTLGPFDVKKTGDNNFHFALINQMNPQSWDIYYEKGTIISTSISIKNNKLENLKPITQYPNPFNQTTTVKFKISKQTNVKIIIYDTNGKEVNDVVSNKLYNPGEYSVTWNSTTSFGKEVSSGIYILAVFFDNKLTSTNKLLLVR